MKKIMIAFAWTVCVLTACDKNKPSQTEMQALPVDVAKPLVENVTLTKDYPGYLEAESTVDLVGRVNGTLQSKNFAPGSRVRQGQVLFVIEPTLYENSVKQAEAELKTAKANLEYAVSSYQRMKEAIKSDAVSRIQYLQAESHVAACEAAVSNAEAALKTARTNLSYCYVKAPCDGVVDVSAYSVGAYIGGALQPVKLATVYKDNRMYSYFNIADNQYLTYELAQEAASKIPAETHFVTLRLLRLFIRQGGKARAHARRHNDGVVHPVRRERRKPRIRDAVCPVETAHGAQLLDHPVHGAERFAGALRDGALRKRRLARGTGGNVVEQRKLIFCQQDRQTPLRSFS